MNLRAQYLFQILDKIGSPIMEAVIETSKASGADAPTQDAQALAAMLGKAVQASISLGQAIDANPVDTGDDSLRVALAGLAAPLVAGQMRKLGGVPEDTDVQRIVTALQAALTFADNFTPSVENVARMENLKTGKMDIDSAQASLQYVMAFTPVAQAVSVFSFGQAEQKLIVEISERIVKRAEAMQQALLPNLSGDEQKQAALTFVSALARVYAACHETETRKASAISPDIPAEAQPSMNSVWAGFDMQVSMLEAMAGSLVPESTAAGATQSGGGVTPVAPPVQEQQPVQPPPIAAPPQQPVQPPPTEAAEVAPPPPPSAPPVQQETASAPLQQNTEQSTEGNPMAMFAKPKTQDDAATSAPPVTSPVQPPPVATPPQEQQIAQPPFTPPATPTTPTPQEEDGEDSGDESSGGSPMSFFKKGD